MLEMSAPLSKQASCRYLPLGFEPLTMLNLALHRPKVRHHSLAIYVLLRGITLLVRCGNKPDAPKLVRRLLAPTRWQHGDTGLMCLCTSQLAYSWICKPQTLPPTFVHFLNKHGGKEMWFYRAARVRTSLPVLCPGCAAPFFPHLFDTHR